MLWLEISDCECNFFSIPNTFDFSSGNITAHAQ